MSVRLLHVVGGTVVAVVLALAAAETQHSSEKYTQPTQILW